MVVDGSSKSKKSRKNNGGNSNKNVSSNQEPQQQPQNESTTNSKNGNNVKRKSVDIISDKQRSQMLLEASMTELKRDSVDKNDSDDNCYDRESVHERLHEIDLNLVSDASEESSSSSPTSYLTDNENLGGKLNNLTIKSDIQKQNTKMNKFNSDSAFNEFNNHNNQEQLLDNTAIQHLISEQTKSYLILDDLELLQCKSSNEFIALFRSKYLAQANLSDDSTKSLTSQEMDGIHKNSTNTSSQLSPNSQFMEDKLVKCVSIFGNTGDGKSHTLNHTFFNGRNIFQTSNKQETCTMGVWCAYDSHTNSLIFDTEGLLGTTSNENKRMRLLLKVLAISDVIIYRTRAERLHNDLFKFLSDASVAYLKYFSKELKTAATKLKLDTISSLGPCCVIFHETQHTDILCDEFDHINGNERHVSHQIAERFSRLDLSYDAFSSIEYVGTRTCFNAVNDNNNNRSGGVLKPSNSFISTDFTKLAQTVRDLLRNNSVRPPRKLSSIYQVLKVLNDKFNGTITKNQISTFADEYFTCSSVCLCCGKRCQNSINHLKDSILHSNSERCHYDHQYDNKVYVCRLCHESGKEVIVIPKTSASNDNSILGIVKYTYSGYVLECPHHGIIFRSRQYWYGNPDPESVVRTELKHIWSGQQNHVGTSHNLSRKIIDNVSYIGESIHSVSAKPTQIAKQWMADQIAPSYWTPNSDLISCKKCDKPFIEIIEKKHHCRGCGKGFCDKCSSKRRVIPWWSVSDKVRVCDECFEKKTIPEPKIFQTNRNSYYANNTQVSVSNNYQGLPVSSNNDLIGRKVTETVQDTIEMLHYATKVPIDLIKETARPSYWKPDHECVACKLCKKNFDEFLPLHHCRSCGDGVCHSCSPNLREVPSRGWETPVRVCNNCVQNEVPEKQD